MTQDLDQRLADIEAREARFARDRLAFSLRAALVAAKCRPDAVEDAVMLMSASASPEFDAEGQLAKITVGAADYGTADQAVAEFMRARQHWATQSGPDPLVLSKVPPNKPADEIHTRERSPLELVHAGWSKPTG